MSPDIAKDSLGGRITPPVLRTTDRDETTSGYFQAAQRLALYLWETKTQIQGLWRPNVCKPSPTAERQGRQMATGEFKRGVTKLLEAIASGNRQEEG